MKHIRLIIICIILLISPILMFSIGPKDVDSTAADTNFVIDLGLHNYVNRLYSPAIMMEIGLPISEKFKIYTTVYVHDAFFQSTNLSNAKTETLSTLNNHLKLWIGIPISENFELSFNLGGGSLGDPTNALAYQSVSDSNSDNTKYTIDLTGILNFGLGLKLNSVFFKDKINYFIFRQYADFMVGGQGDAGGYLSIPNSYFVLPAFYYSNIFLGLVSPFYNIISNLTKYSSTVGYTRWKTISTPYPLSANINSVNDFNFQYFGVIYTGRFLTEIPIHFGLPKFGVGFDLGYNITSITYSAANSTVGRATSELFDSKPTLFCGAFDVKLNIGLNFSPAVETNFWLDPGYAIAVYNWTVKGLPNSKQTTNAFQLRVGADWKATFAKIVYAKFDAEWKFNLQKTESPSTSSLSISTAFMQLNPGITLGFNFEGWTLELLWEPSFTAGLYSGITNYDNSGNVANNTAADTNLWNLSNWSISAKCSFPKPQSTPTKTSYEEEQ